MESKLKKISNIKLGKSLFARDQSSAFDVAAELLDGRYTMVPVVDRNHRVVGVVSQQDLLRALCGPTRLEEINAKQIMFPAPITVEAETTLVEVNKIMDIAKIGGLPVVKQGRLVGTVTRHDLLRTWLGLGSDI